MTHSRLERAREKQKFSFFLPKHSFFGYIFRIPICYAFEINVFDDDVKSFSKSVAPSPKRQLHLSSHVVLAVGPTLRMREQASHWESENKLVLDIDPELSRAQLLSCRKARPWPQESSFSRSLSCVPRAGEAGTGGGRVDYPTLGCYHALGTRFHNDARSNPGLRDLVTANK